MRPLFKPVVTVTKKVNLTLEEIQKRVAGAPNFVRVGLPDSMTTEEGDQKRKARDRGRRKP